MSFDNKITKSLIKQYFTSFDYAVDLVTSLAMRSPDYNESLEIMKLADKIKDKDGNYQIDLVDISGIPINDVQSFVQKYNEEHLEFKLENRELTIDNEKSSTLFAVSIQPIDAAYEAVLVPTKLREVFDDFIKEYRNLEIKRDLENDKNLMEIDDIEITRSHELEENQPKLSADHPENMDEKLYSVEEIPGEEKEKKDNKSNKKKSKTDENEKIRQEQERINQAMREQRARREQELTEQRKADERRVEEQRRTEQHRTDERRVEEQRRTDEHKADERRVEEQRRTEQHKAEQQHKADERRVEEQRRTEQHRTDERRVEEQRRTEQRKAEQQHRTDERKADTSGEYRKKVELEQRFEYERRQAEAKYAEKTRRAELEYERNVISSQSKYNQSTTTSDRTLSINTESVEKHHKMIHQAAETPYKGDTKHYTSSTYTTMNRNIKPLENFSQEKMMLRQSEYSRSLDAEKYHTANYNSYTHKSYNMSSVGIFESQPLQSSSTPNPAKSLVETKAIFNASEKSMDIKSNVGSSTEKFLEKQGDTIKSVIRESYRESIDQAGGRGTFQKAMEVKQVFDAITSGSIGFAGAGSAANERLINSTISDFSSSRQFSEFNSALQNIGLDGIKFDNMKAFQESFVDVHKLVESSLNQSDVFKLMDVLHIDEVTATRLAGQYHTLLQQNNLITNHMNNIQFAKNMRNKASGQIISLVTVCMRNLYKDNEGASYLIGCASIGIQGIRVIATPTGQQLVKTIAKPVTVPARYVARGITKAGNFTGHAIAGSKPFIAMANSNAVKTVRNGLNRTGNAINTAQTGLVRFSKTVGQGVNKIASVPGNLVKTAGRNINNMAKSVGSKAHSSILKLANKKSPLKIRPKTGLKSNQIKLVKKAAKKARKNAKKLAKKARRKVLRQKLAKKLTDLFRFFGNLKRAIIIVFVAGFLISYLILGLGELLATPFLFIYSAFEYDGADSSKYIMEEVFNALCQTESEWIDNFVNTGRIGRLTDIHYLLYTKDEKEIEDYVIDKNWTLYTDGVKGPTPFTGAPEEAYKHINIIDGGNDYTFYSAYGAISQTSNIKDILCMSTVFFEQGQDTLNEEEPTNKFTAALSSLKTKLGNFIKNMRDNWNAIISKMSFLSGLKAGTVADERKQSIVEQSYTQAVYTYSHDESFELQMVKLPIGEEDNSGNENEAVNGLLMFCPDSHMDGCKQYDNFYYLDDGSISGDNATSAEGCEITKIGENCALLESDAEKDASPCWEKVTDTVTSVVPTSVNSNSTTTTTTTTTSTTHYEHKCVGGHSGRYCGGHLQLTSRAYVYTITPEQLSEQSGTIISKVPEPSSPIPQIDPSEGIIVDEAKLDQAHDIFDIDSALRHAIQPVNWCGWDSCNMEWTVVLFNQDWEDIYDMTVGQILGSCGQTGGSSFTPGNNGAKRGVPMTQAEILGYMSDIIGKQITEADLKSILAGTYTSSTIPAHNLQAAAYAFGWVGKIGYGQMPGHDWELKEGGLTDCSGFASRCWMYTGHDYGINNSASYYSKSVPISSSATAGDIFVRKGHVMLFVGMSPDGKYRFVESNIAPGGGKQGPGNVYYREVTLSWLHGQGYQMVPMP